MATYTTTKCPHCGNVFRVMERKGTKHYGCPFLKCQSCGASCFDPNITEISIEGLDKRIARKIQGITIGILLLGGAFLAAGIALGPTSDNMGPVYFWMGLIIVVFDLYLLFDGIVNHRKNVKSYLIEYEVSRLRTSSPQYIQRLQQCGYKFPRDFIQTELSIDFLQKMFAKNLPDIDLVWWEVKRETGQI